MQAKTLCLAVLPMIFVGVPSSGYEDKSHQALTRQAVEVAKARGIGTLAAYEQAIINGAGAGPGARGGGDPASTDGEDYTTYEIRWECPRRVTPRVFVREPLEHFMTEFRITPFHIAGPAYVKFTQFYRNAVELWRRGKKQDAAFILGRAVHLVEDMAQPQHAGKTKD